MNTRQDDEAPGADEQTGSRERDRISRRLFVAGAVAGLGLSLLNAPGRSHAATASPSPLLPGEYTRKSNQLTRYKGTLFDNIVVKIKGDPARLYIPQSIKPGQTAPIRVVWLYHGAGSDHNALDGGFKTTGERIVDEGAIAICQKDGGTLWSHPTAQVHQKNGYAYMASLYPIDGNYLRATSGGGALACEVYGSKLIPDILGMYNVNAVYDLEAVYNMGGSQRAAIVAAFGDDPQAIHAANPARLPASAWTGDRLRIVVAAPSSTDTSVPPDDHGLALLALASPVAAEASLRTHANGHSTPGFADLDFVATMQRWAPPTAPPADTTPPTVTVTSPTGGAALAGAVTLTAAATDDTGVTGVAFACDGSPIGEATLADGAWSLSYSTTDTPNGAHTVTAIATDAAGNTATSAPVEVTVQNADTTAPVVRISAPADGATISGTVVATAVASDDVAVTAVRFYTGTRLIGSATLADGVWSLPFNTKTRVTPNGSYTFTARAEDAAGNVGVSEAVGVRIAN